MKKKINNECDLIQEYLKLSEDSEPCMLDFVLVAEPEKNPTVNRLPKEVSKYIKTKLRPYQFGQKKFKEGKLISELKLSPEWGYVRKNAKDFFLKNPAVKSGHYTLKTGWHTDRLVNCRELCSDINFVTNLCSMLASKYSEYGFTDILSVGTSAIGIGSLLFSNVTIKKQS